MAGGMIVTQWIIDCEAKRTTGVYWISESQ